MTFRFRSGRYQASNVLICYNGLRVNLVWERHKNDFDYYSTQIIISSEKIDYYFEIDAENNKCYYGKTGTVFRKEDVVPYELIPDFHIPKWMRGAIMYQIFVDRFFNGDTTNDVADGEYEYYKRPVRKVSDWDELPETLDVGNFHGGDLSGVMAKLDYLKDLGIEVLYLNPVFLSPSNHKYDIEDYDHVDPHVGVMIDSKSGRTAIENLEASNTLLISLIEKAHEKGMKVILDGVFNHCSHLNSWMDVPGEYRDKEGKRIGAYKNPESAYDSYFTFKDSENIEYECWWDNLNLPKLNYEDSDELFQNIMRIAEKWVSSPYNADGWRLDVASDLGHTDEMNHKFWREFRKHVKKANKDAIIIAEHYDNAAVWLDGDQWDTIMNYRTFMEPVSWFFTGMEKHSDQYINNMIGNAEAFEATMTTFSAEFNGQSLMCAMNQLDNHDHSRFITRTNHKVLRLTDENHALASEDTDLNVYRLAVIMQMTWPGAPCLYYGDETALPGFTDPDSRRAFPWGKENKELISFYKKIIALRKKHDFLRCASYRVIFAQNKILSYARFNENERLVVVFSMETSETDVEIPVWITGMAGYKEEDLLLRVLYCDNDCVSFTEKKYNVRYGILSLHMAPKSAIVLYGED